MVGVSAGTVVVVVVGAVDEVVGVAVVDVASFEAEDDELHDAANKARTSGSHREVDMRVESLGALRLFRHCERPGHELQSPSMLAVRAPIDAVVWLLRSRVVEPGTGNHNGLKPRPGEGERTRHRRVCSVELRPGSIEKSRFNTPTGQFSKLNRSVSSAEKRPFLELRRPQPQPRSFQRTNDLATGAFVGTHVQRQGTIDHVDVVVVPLKPNSTLSEFAGELV